MSVSCYLIPLWQLSDRQKFLANVFFIFFRIFWNIFQTFEKLKFSQSGLLTTAPSLTSCFLQISWIRYKDTSLLTVGRYTYTTDLRFEALHSPHTDDWIVRLKNPRPSDSGIYGCQISTTPHRTQLVYLTVHGKFKKN